jgi:hypothetical protein
MCADEAPVKDKCPFHSKEARGICGCGVE